MTLETFSSRLRLRIRLRNVAPFLILFLIVILIASTSCSKNEAANQQSASDGAVPVSVAKVESATMDRTLPVVGTLFAKDEATIGAEVEGRVQKTLVDFGDRLKKDQIIAYIDTDLYEALARQAAANLTKTRASATNADQTLERTRSLHRDK